MSLDWKLSKIANWAEVAQETPEWPVTNGIIWSMLRIGMNEITANNWTEVYARIRIAERIGGTLLKANKEDCPITADDVRRRVGLTTNCERVPLKTWLLRFALAEYQEGLRHLSESSRASASSGRSK